jgi:hypothetical protein
MKKILTILFTIGIFTFGFSQENSDFILWSSSHKLTINDFGIKKGNSKSGLCFAQF